MRWSSRSLGARWQHAFFAVLLRARLPFLASAIVFVIVLYYTLHPGIRMRIMPYVTKKFKTDGKTAALLHVFRIYSNFARLLLLRMSWRCYGKESQKISIAAEARQQLTEALEKNRGCLILSAHLGAWQLAIAGLKKIGRPLTIVQYIDTGDVDKHYFEGNGSDTITIVNSAEGASAWIHIAATLRRGELVCLMGDRLMPTEPLPTATSFLGTCAQFPASPYWIANATGSPVLACFSYLSGERVHIEHVTPILLPRKKTRDARKFAQTVRQFSHAMEQFLLEHPHQFFNFYDLWSHYDKG